MTNYEYMIKCIRLFNLGLIDPIVDIDDNDVVTYGINTNDLFFWGTADVVYVTPDNVDMLERAIADLKVVGSCYVAYSGELFACRVSGMRPQGAAYPAYKELWELFDACGPVRKLDIVNPCEPGFGSRKVHVYCSMFYDLWYKARSCGKVVDGVTVIDTPFVDGAGEFIVFSVRMLADGKLCVSCGNDEGIILVDDEGGRLELLKLINKWILRVGGNQLV